jgi:hypothetical protein
VKPAEQKRKLILVPDVRGKDQLFSTPSGTETRVVHYCNRGSEAKRKEASTADPVFAESIEHLHHHGRMVVSGSAVGSQCLLDVVLLGTTGSGEQAHRDLLSHGLASVQLAATDMPVDQQHTVLGRELGVSNDATTRDASDALDGKHVLRDGDSVALLSKVLSIDIRVYQCPVRGALGSGASGAVQEPSHPVPGKLWEPVMTTGPLPGCASRGTLELLFHKNHYYLLLSARARAQYWTGKAKPGKSENGAAPRHLTELGLPPSILPADNKQFLSRFAALLMGTSVSACHALARLLRAQLELDKPATILNDDNDSAHHGTLGSGANGSTTHGGNAPRTGADAASVGMSSSTSATASQALSVGAAATGPCTSCPLNFLTSA